MLHSPFHADVNTKRKCKKKKPLDAQIRQASEKEKKSKGKSRGGGEPVLEWAKEETRLFACHIGFYKFLAKSW